MNHHPSFSTTPFVFTQTNLQRAKDILKKYPPLQAPSAIVPLLGLAQKQNKGWLCEAAIACVATMVGVPFMRVYEVATFYTLFNLKPVGKYFVQLCTTTPCMLCGSDELVRIIKNTFHVGPDEPTPDGLVSFREVECLGACANGPVVQINDDYYEDLDPQSFENLLKGLKNNALPPPGSAKGRCASQALPVRLSKGKKL